MKGVIMVAATNKLMITNESSLLEEFFNKAKNKLEILFAQRELYKLQTLINEQFLIIMNIAHEANAEIESIEDIVNNYYINDIEHDEEIFQNISSMLDTRTESLEAVLDIIEELNNINDFPQHAKDSLYNAFNELYENIINTNFLISQKIASIYLDTEKNKKLLEEA